MLGEIISPKPTERSVNPQHLQVGDIVKSYFDLPGTKHTEGGEFPVITIDGTNVTIQVEETQVTIKTSQILHAVRKL